MNHSEFTRILARDLGIPIKVARNRLSTLVATMTRALVRDGSLHLREFGVFTVVRIPANTVTSGVTGKKMVMPERVRIAYRTPELLKRVIQQIGMDDWLDEAGKEQEPVVGPVPCYGRHDPGDADCRGHCLHRDACMAETRERRKKMELRLAHRRGAS